MAREIRIQYEEVYTKTAELRQRLQSELQEMDTAYRQAQTSLRHMDSRTNAEFMETMASNQIKSKVAAETISKLLSFIESSARQVERDEAMIQRVFTLSRAGARREGSGS